MAKTTKKWKKYEISYDKIQITNFTEGQRQKSYNIQFKNSVTTTYLCTYFIKWHNRTSENRIVLNRCVVQREKLSFDEMPEKNCGSYFVNKITEVEKQRQESSMTCDYTNQKEYLPSKTKEGKKKPLKKRRQIAYENVWQMLIIWELKREEKCVQEFQWVDLADPNGSCQTREQIYFGHSKRKRYINLKIAVWMWVINDLYIWFIRGFWVCWTSFHSFNWNGKTAYFASQTHIHLALCFRSLSKFWSGICWLG